MIKNLCIIHIIIAINVCSVKLTLLLLCLTFNLYVADPRGTTTCTIISTSLPGLITDGGPISIIIGTQNVIIYCICMRGSNNVGVGPTIWSRSNGQVTLTTTDGTDGNPYYRDNVPSPLIIPFFNATHADTYHCRSGSPGVTLDATITLTVQSMYNYISSDHYTVGCKKRTITLS